MMCPCDALGVALSVQDEGLHSTGIPHGVCVVWTPLVITIAIDRAQQALYAGTSITRLGPRVVIHSLHPRFLVLSSAATCFL